VRHFVSKVLKIRPREFKRVFHLTERFATTAQALVTRGLFWPHFGRILFAAGCFRTLFDVVVVLQIRVIPRKLWFDVAMQNAQNVFESLQGHLSRFRIAAILSLPRVTAVAT
jgi:hypothetical protein